MERRKILLFAGLFIIAAVVALSIYVLFFRSEEKVQYVNINGKLIPISSLPTIGEGGVPRIIINARTGLPEIEGVNAPSTEGTQEVLERQQIRIDDTAKGGFTRVFPVTSDRVKGLSEKGTAKYYNADDGKFYRVDEDGKPVALSDKVFFDVDRVTWSPKGNKAILEYPDGANIYYDFDTKKQLTLPKQMTNFDFSQTGDKIAFEWYSEFDTSDNWLGVSSPDGSQLTFIEPIGDKGDYVQPLFSPDNKIAALYSEGSGLDSMEVFFIGQSGENYKSLPVYGRGFEGAWTPDGKRLLYSVYSSRTGDRPELWIASASGNDIGKSNRPLKVETWARKCAFGQSESSVYCAVPAGLPEGAGFYPDIAKQYPDMFYKIDLKTGARTLLAQPVGDQEKFSAADLSVSPDGNFLYFSDEISGKIYSLRLK